MSRQYSTQTSQDIEIYIRDAISHASTSPAPPKPLSLVSSKDARTVLNEIWKKLESSTLPETTRIQYRRLSLKLAIEYHVFPSSLILLGVQCDQLTQNEEGGFADVFCGTYRGKKVAVKRVRVFATYSEPERRKLKRSIYRESLLWKGLKHEHVIPFFGVSEDLFPGKTCMVLPWMDNGSLRQYLHRLRDGPIPDIEFVAIVDRWLHQIALGVAYLHSEGLVHGDLHAGNVLLDADMAAQITDFGMCVIAEGTAYNYSSIHGGGAVRWAAPELIDPEEFGHDSSRPTCPSDVYSLALTAIELYTRTYPFPEFNNLQVPRRIVKGSRPSRPTAPGGQLMSTPLWTLLQACWVPAASARPSMRRVVRALKDLIIPPDNLHTLAERTENLHIRVNGRHEQIPFDSKLSQLSITSSLPTPETEPVRVILPVPGLPESALDAKTEDPASSEPLKKKLSAGEQRIAQWAKANARERTAQWVDAYNQDKSGPDFFPSQWESPLLLDNSDVPGYGAMDSDGESSHSLPPRMVLRYPDGRPDIPIPRGGT